MKLVTTGHQHRTKTKIYKAQGNVQNASGHSNAKIKDASCPAAMLCQIQRAFKKWVKITFAGVATSLCQEHGVVQGNNGIQQTNSYYLASEKTQMPGKTWPQDS